MESVYFQRLLNFLLIFIFCFTSTMVIPSKQVDASTAQDNFYGMYCGSDTNVAKAIPVMKDLGVKWVRLWYDINDWSTPPTSLNDALQRAVQLKAEGFNIIMEFNALNGTTPTGYEQVKAYFDAVQNLRDESGSSIKDSIDIWEILNELNLQKYWAGTPEQYVNEVLKAAWDSIHIPSYGSEKILGGCFTAWQLNPTTGEYGVGNWTLEQYINSGYLNYVDYAGIHPYTNSLQEMKDFMSSALNLVSGKPVIISEWNFKQRADYAEWADDLVQARAWLYGRVETVCYYRLLKSQGEGGWPGVVNNDAAYSPVQPFYDAYKNFPKGVNTLIELEGRAAESSSGDLMSVSVNSQASAGSYAVYAANTPEDYVSYEIQVPNEGYYSISTILAKDSSFGQFQLEIDGSPLGPVADLYSSVPGAHYFHSHGAKHFTSGNHTFTFKVIAKNVNSADYKLGLDAINLSHQDREVIVDTQPPNAPENFAATYRTDSTVELSWGQSTDDTGVISYQIFRGDTLIGTTRSESIKDTGLLPGTNYSYFIKAFDAAGNASQKSITDTTTYTDSDTTPPTAPSGLTATIISMKEVDLNWTVSVDDRVVPSYRVFRDGKEIGTSSVNSFTDNNAWSDTTYTYTLKAFDRENNSSVESNAVSAATPSFYGMHCGGDTDVEKAVPFLRDMGVKWVRLWYDVFDWSDPTKNTTGGAFQKAIDFKKQGFNVIVEFNQHDTQNKVPTYQQVKAFFDWAQSVPEVKDSIDVWEILNELNLSKYWEGTPEQYVDQVLKASWDSLHPNGEKVLGGSWTAWQNNTYGTEITAQYINAGYLNYCDYAGFHPYTDNLSNMQKVMTQAITLFNGKPIIITEWNFKQMSNHSNWAASLSSARAWLYGKVHYAMYYRFLGMSGEGGWPGVVQADAQGNYGAAPVFYDMFRNWPKGPSTGMEVESLKVMGKTDFVGNYAASGTSAGYYTAFSGNAPEDYVSFNVNVPHSGEYSINTTFTRDTKQGTYQLLVNNTEVGTPMDTYGSWTHGVANVHGVANLIAGDNIFKYKVTGKHPDSSGYSTRLDKIDLSLVPPPPGSIPKTPKLNGAQAGNGIVRLSWEPVEGVSGYKVKYGTEPDNYTANIEAGTSPGFTISGLENNKTYYFAVSAYNMLGESGPSNEISVTPYSETVLNVAKAGSGAVQLSWNAVNDVANYNIKFGTSGGNYSSVINAGKSTTYVVDGLTDGVAYYFVVTTITNGTESQNSNELKAVPASYGSNLLANSNFETGTLEFWEKTKDSSGSVSITTSDPHSGTYSAKISTKMTGFEQLVTGLVKGETYTLRAYVKGDTSSDTVHIGVKEVFGPGSVTQYSTTAGADGYNKQAVMIFTAGYTSVKVYAWKSSSSASGGAYLDDFELLQSSSSDNEAPTEPSALIATSVRSTGIDLSWVPSTDNTGVSGYKVYRDGVDIASIKAAMYTDTGLVPSTSYTYNIRAFDSAGNMSGPSNTITVVTLEPDMEAPTAPANLTAEAVSTNQINLSWLPSNDNLGVKGYRIYRNEIEVVSVGHDANNYSDMGLLESTSYIYYVKAIDESGNLSEASNIVAVKTKGSGILNPAADAHIDSSNINSNYGSSNTIEVYKDATMEKRGLIRFDMSGIDGNNVSSAVLSLKKYYWGNTVEVVAIYPLSDDDWTEGGVKWSNQPGMGDTLLATSISGSVVNFDITNYVNERLKSDKLVSLGIVINGGSGRASFYSRNHGTASSRPVLTLSDITTEPERDIEPPSVPGGLKAVPVSGTQITLNWNESTDNVGVTGYNIYRNNQVIGVVTSPSYNDINLSEAVTYSYYITALDGAGNMSGASSSVSISIDKTPPTVIATVYGKPLVSGIIFEDYEQPVFNIMINDSNSGVAQSQITIDGSPYTQGTRLDLPGLQGEHIIQVVATDKAGNSTNVRYTFKVITSIPSMEKLVERYVTTGNIKGPLVPQLLNSLKQAEHHLNKGSKKQAAKHLQNFIKHLNNEAMKDKITEKARDVLYGDALTIINQL